MLSSEIAEYSIVYDICIVVYSNKKEGKDDPDSTSYLNLPYPLLELHCRPEFPHGVIYSG